MMLIKRILLKDKSWINESSVTLERNSIFRISIWEILKAMTHLCLKLKQNII